VDVAFFLRVELLSFGVLDEIRNPVVAFLGIIPNNQMTVGSPMSNELFGVLKRGKDHHISVHIPDDVTVRVGSLDGVNTV
jgi:hypothetical protein